MSVYESWAILILAAAIHASFQLSVSMLTILSGHALTKKTAQARLMRLISSFFAGVALMVTLSLSFLAFAARDLLHNSYAPSVVWAAVSGFAIGVGVAVWAFYYRHKTRGTVLWLPRSLADYLASRAKKTKLAGESFGLGLVSVVAEYLFCLAPLLIAALVIIQMPLSVQLVGLIVYVVIATLPLATSVILIGSGHSIARIQRWREQNKRFLQFAAGSALIILGVYVYVGQVLAPTLSGGYL
ncbi:hypothetical protein KC945_02070 [Candidatus Saccharibacteria bacterium]|nr:hypothetical protein [Candidatus Saccharibacteria bacterium]